MGRKPGYIASNAKDHSGEVHNYWTIMNYEFTKNKKRHYRFRCRCGTVRVCHIRRILIGESKSCGCLNAKNHTIHNKSKSRIYNIWIGMKNRCLNPNSDKWEYYGGRGIHVCERWIDNFEAFYSDMGEPPTRKHSIDRIDVNGNYEFLNCRWATPLQQARNRRIKPLPEPTKQKED